MLDVSGSHPLRITVLGGLGATLAGEPVNVGGRQQRAVLALLVLAHGDVVSADRLVECLWSGSAPGAAAPALQAAVSRLRRRLEPTRTARSRDNVIVSRAGGYALTVDDDAVDAWRFESAVRAAGRAADPARTVAALSDALSLWRGPALAEFADEGWARPEVTRLTELREVAREQLLAARLALGETAVLVPELEALVTEAPLREERWRLLVLALYRSGRQGDALGALRRARLTLADQLGVDPGPVLRTLETEVLTHASHLDGPAPAPASPPPASPQQTTAAQPSPAAATDGLVDRTHELAMLADCVADALDGRARLVVVQGPAGIGKSRLLAEARRIAVARGALPLSARGSQMERPFGFGVVRQLFETLVARSPGPDGPLGGAAAPAAAVFDLAPDADPGDHSFAVLHGLYWLTARAADRQPLVVTVDDLQWCDTASLRFLAYLVRRLEGLPVVAVAALRTGERYEDDDLLAELLDDPVARVVRPAALSPDGVGELVRRGLGDGVEDGFVAACHRSTYGNPLLLRQLLRALEAAGVRPTAAHADTVNAIGSRAVSGMVLVRLRRMAAPAVMVARAIAVLGDGAGLPTVAALAGITEPEAAATIAALGRAEVIRDEYPLGFVHPLVRDAVYHDLAPGERQLFHERAARTLAAGGATAEQIAAHLLQIPQRGDPWVVQVLGEAARVMVKRGAPDGAATYLRRALTEPPDRADRPGLLLECGLAEALGDAPAAIAHLREAVDDPHTDPATFAVVANVLSHTLLFAGAPGESTAFARRAAGRLPTDLVDERQTLLAMELTSAYMSTGDPGVWTDRPAPPVTGTALGARMLSSTYAWQAMVRDGSRTDAVRHARFALADGRLLREDPGLFWVIAGLVIDLAEQDAGAFWDEALGSAYTRGSLFSVMAAHMWRGFNQWRRGDLPEAYESLSVATEQSAQWAGGLPTFGVTYGRAFQLAVLVDRGDLAAAHRLSAEHGVAGPGEGGRLFDEARAALLVAEGRFVPALDLLARTAVGSAVQIWPYFRSGLLTARCLAGLDRPEEALAVAGDVVAAARRWGASAPLGAALRVVGEIRHGVAELREAVALLRTSPCRLEYARALAALAAAVPGRAPERLDLQRTALQLATQCGATGLRDQLVRAGVEVATGPGAAPTVTTTERTIVAMAADGADEWTIAQALFLTPTAVRDVLTRLRG